MVYHHFSSLIYPTNETRPDLSPAGSKSPPDSSNEGIETKLMERTHTIDFLGCWFIKKQLSKTSQVSTVSVFSSGVMIKTMINTSTPAGSSAQTLYKFIENTKVKKKHMEKWVDPSVAASGADRGRLGGEAPGLRWWF